MYRIYYWQAKDKLVAVHFGRMVGISSLSENYFYVIKPRSRMPKTLVYLGDL